MTFLRTPTVLKLAKAKRLCAIGLHNFLYSLTLSLLTSRMDPFFSSVSLFSSSTRALRASPNIAPFCLYPWAGARKLCKGCFPLCNLAVPCLTKLDCPVLLEKLLIVHHTHRLNLQFSSHLCETEGEKSHCKPFMHFTWSRNTAYKFFQSKGHVAWFKWKGIKWKIV